MSYDLYLDIDGNNGRRPFKFGTKQARAVTGLTKLANRFVKLLLEPERVRTVGGRRVTTGTNLLRIAEGNGADSSYITAQVHLAVQAAAAQTKLSGDSSLAQATVLRVVITGSRVDIYVELVTNTGVRMKAVVPIPT